MGDGQSNLITLLLSMHKNLSVYLINRYGCHAIIYVLNDWLYI